MKKIALFLCVSCFATTETVTDSTLANNMDSYFDCKKRLLEDMKRTFLEKIATHISSVTEVQNSQLTKDEITSCTEGIVEMVILKEDKTLNRGYYRATCRLSADSQKVIELTTLCRLQRINSLISI